MFFLIIAGGGCALLIIIGGLIGFRLAELSLASKARRQAALQRELNEQARRLERQLSLLA